MKAIKRAIENYTAFNNPRADFLDEHVHMSDTGGKRASKKDLGHLLKF